MSVPDLWVIDSRVLAVLIVRLEGLGAPHVDAEDVEVDGVPTDAVPGALRRLYRDGLIDGSTVDLFDHPVVVTAVTPRGLREAGAWPTPERLPDQITRLLEQAADRAEDPEQQTVLRRAAHVVGGSLREILVGLAIAQGS